MGGHTHRFWVLYLYINAIEALSPF
jgi:hypothetical protein